MIPPELSARPGAQSRSKQFGCLFQFQMFREAGEYRHAAQLRIMTTPIHNPGWAFEDAQKRPATTNQVSGVGHLTTRTSEWLRIAHSPSARVWNQGDRCPGELARLQASVPRRIGLRVRFS